MNPLKDALWKIVDVLEAESIDYMIVGGFATSYHNRSRTTNDIDVVVQIHANSVKNILQHFPEWMSVTEEMTELFEQNGMFNITDWQTGIRFDIMAYKDSDYNWAAFQRRGKEVFLEREVYLCAVEDLIIGKLQWYNISNSEKQLSDLMYLVKAPDINWNYLNNWVEQLNIRTHGILGKDGKRDGGSGGGSSENLLFFPRQ
jgi:hypothetical protein